MWSLAAKYSLYRIITSASPFAFTKNPTLTGGKTYK